jgi:O-antigen biosynthesis protein WbqP
MKRFFDLLLAFFVLIVAFFPMMLITFIIKLTSEGPALYWSDRIGINKVIFGMPKFRTMKIDTPSVATHLLNDPESFYIPFGKFLRQTSLDELPQIWSIIVGDMSFVGPRPALFNQDDLANLRDDKGINHLKPGLTGWAQINGRDDLSIEEKVHYDYEYSQKKSISFDLIILFKTFIKAFKRKDISH